MILNSYVVTYLLLSFLSLLVGIAALMAGVSAAWNWKPGSSSEDQYRLEKKVYLSMTLIMLGFTMRLALAPLWFFMLQSLVPSIPGAMCLCGVHLLKTPYSFISTTLKFLLPMAYGYWLALNALDRKIETQPLMKRKLYTLIPLSALMFFESFSDLRFLFAVRPRFVNCCSSLFDDSSSALLQKMTYSGWGWVVVFFVAAILLLGVSAFLARRPRSRAGAALWILSPLTLVAFIMAAHTRLSPMFLHAEFHHCVFCVWQKLPDMIVTTAAICIGCWAALIYAATRNVHKYPGCGGRCGCERQVLMKWALGALLLGIVLLATRADCGVHFNMKGSKQISRMLLRVVLVAMILVMTGGHWLILQSVAWTKMIVDYSRSSSVGTAIKQTFDGRHPCDICKWIQKEKQSSKQQELKQPSVPDDVVFAETHTFSFFDPPCSWIPGDGDFIHPSRCDPPPVPPPRSLLV